jgi:Spy/CpxP family protein refolding chaperone
MLGRCRPFAVCLAIVLAVCFTACVAAEAQRERPEGRGRESEREERTIPRDEWEGFREFARRHGGKDVREQEIPEIIELVRAWRMMKEVGLTEEESAKLFGLRREIRRKAAELAEQRERARDELRKLVDDPQTTNEAIAAQLKALEKIEERRAALRSERESTMPERLSVRQQAKFKLFSYHFDRHVRERLIQHIEERREREREDRPGERRGDRDGRGRRDP